MIVSDFMAENLLRQYFSENDGLHIAIFTDEGTEISSPGYARQPVRFSLPTKESGVYAVTNVNDVEFSEAPTDWGYAVNIAVTDSATDGNLLYRGRLNMTRRINVGDALRISAGQLRLTLA